MASDIMRQVRPPLPALRMGGLAPGLSRVREALSILREEHDGLHQDVAAYTAAVGQVRDHVRTLHEDLQFELSEGGNGGQPASPQRVEEHVAEILGGGQPEQPPVETVYTPLPDGSSTGQGGAKNDH